MSCGRRLHGRVRPKNHERWFLIQLSRWSPSILKVLTIVRPETLVRWHRTGFRSYLGIGFGELSRFNPSITGDPRLCGEAA